ncbi:MAG: stage II sporulation protein M [Nannocystaceae bacterium]|nr:stage II sporulation protein M [Nannocystaceae bacterium]
MMANSGTAQDRFVAERRRHWERLEALMQSGRALHRMSGSDISAVGRLYRNVCGDLMHARARGYSADLVAFLDALAAKAHNGLYSAHAYDLDKALALVTRDFPAAFRASAMHIVAAAALLIIPFVVAFVATLSEPALAHAIVPAEQLDALARAYVEGFSTGRPEAADTAMAGFYLRHNVGIAFQCFAGGIIFGLGSVYLLVYNGIALGAVLGYVTAAGGGENIATFVAGHGAFELTAIVIAGAAGLRMGDALVQPGAMTRLASLRAQASVVGRLIVGAALMLVIAALIEGYWSPSSVPMALKWTVSIALWLGVVAYFALSGRRGVVESR